MIPLSLPATSEANDAFICKVGGKAHSFSSEYDAQVVERRGRELALASEHGTFVVDMQDLDDIAGDVLLVVPSSNRAERIFRAGSKHNTLLVTERCDQLCVMCSQPPKKTHIDRFHYFKQACLLCDEGSMIGVSGGEPTLYKEQLLDLVENTVGVRPDVAFHILTNAQHFDDRDIKRLRRPEYRNVVWGIPLYSPDPAAHDEIVGKAGAFAQLQKSLAILLMAGARVELRTVLMSPNHAVLQELARFVTHRLNFIECWSIMQLENIGFAKNRWAHLYWDHQDQFQSISDAIDQAQLHGVPVRLFNFPRCTVPENYRHLAPASISDWKRKYASACAPCKEKAACSGFFEWHPSDITERVSPL